MVFETPLNPIPESSPEDISSKVRRSAAEVPEEFEDKKFLAEKKRLDPVRVFMRERMGLSEKEIKKINFEYDTTSSVEEKGDKVSGRTVSFSTYHDFLKFRASLSPEQRMTFDRYSWENWGAENKVVEFLADKSIWERLDEGGDLEQYGDEFYGLLREIRGECVPDAFAEAVHRGEIMLPGQKKELSPEEKPLFEARKKYAEAYVRSKKGNAEDVSNAELLKLEYERVKAETARAYTGSSAEIFQKFVLDERELLYQAQVESWPPKERALWKKGLDWWMRQGKYTRLIISTSLVTGAVALTGGFAAAGASGAALFASSRFARGFLSVGAGQLMGKGIEKVWEKKLRTEEKKEEALKALRGEFSLEKLDEANAELEKIMKNYMAERRMKILTKGAGMLLAGIGTSMGLRWLETGLTGGGAAPVEHKAAGMRPSVAERPATATAPHEAPPRPAVPEALKPTAPPETAARAAAQETPTIAPRAAVPEAAAPSSFIETARPGDSVWRMAGRQIEKQYGNEFKNLNDAQKIYIIDAVKDRVMANPGKFGVGSAGELKISQKVDFSEIFEKKDALKSSFESAKKLTEEQMENILRGERGAAVVSPAETAPPTPESEPFVKTSPYEIEEKEMFQQKGIVGGVTEEISPPMRSSVPIEQPEPPVGVKPQEIEEPEVQPQPTALSPEIAEQVRAELSGKSLVEQIKAIEKIQSQLRRDQNSENLYELLRYSQEQQLLLVGGPQSEIAKHALLDQEKIIKEVAKLATSHSKDQYYKDLLRTLQEHPTHTSAVRSYEQKWMSSGLSNQEYAKIKEVKVGDFLKNYGHKVIDNLPREKGLSIAEVSHRRNLAHALDELMRSGIVKKAKGFTIEKFLKTFYMK